MLTAIVSFSLRFRGIVIALACILLVYGISSLSKAKYDVFPEFAPPQVSLQTDATGLNPEQVEVLVTQPIENVINGVPGIESMHSQSAQGLSVVKVIFQPGSDIYRDRQLIAERLSTIVSQLPQGVRTPVMTPLTASTSVVLVLGITSDNASLMDLRTAADWTIRPRLLSVPGVANTVIFDGSVKQLQIQVQPEKLINIKYHLSMDDVLSRNGRSWGRIY
jgi:Cu/Ag efflux pump CusA